MNYLSVTKNKYQEIEACEVVFDLPGDQSKGVVYQTSEPKKAGFCGSIRTFDTNDGFIIVSIMTDDAVVAFHRLPKLETNYVCNTKN